MARTQTRIYVFLAVCGFFFNKSEVQWIHLFCKPVGISYLQTSGSGGAVALRVYGKSAQMHPQPKTIEYNWLRKFKYIETLNICGKGCQCFNISYQNLTNRRQHLSIAGVSRELGSNVELRTFAIYLTFVLLLHRTCWIRDSWIEICIALF